MQSVPVETANFHFYLGADQQELFDSYIESEFPATTISLHIGNSSYELGKGLDYRGLTASLAKAEFPQLETLELGIWQLYCNSHCAFGQIGNIDFLSQCMPNLKHLSVFGKFDLQSYLSFPKLETLSIEVDDPTTGVNGGELDSATVSHLLSSSFPELRELYLNLEIAGGVVCYSIPNVMLTDDVFPKLTAFEIAGDFRAGDKRLLLNSPTLRDKSFKIHLEEMLDSDEQEC